MGRMAPREADSGEYDMTPWQEFLIVMPFVVLCALAVGFLFRMRNLLPLLALIAMWLGCAMGAEYLERQRQGEGLTQIVKAEKCSQ
jgi:hypothetical protein